MKRILLFVAIALSTLTFGQNVPNYVPTNGLVGWWPFNGNANDESGNGNNGTVNGATLTSDRNGVSNSAYDFDGTNSHIIISNSTSLNPTNELSVSSWVNSTATHINAGVIGKWNNFNGALGNGQEQYVMQVNSDGVNFHTMTSTQKSIVEPISIYNDGNWNLFVCTWDGSIMKLYRNGILVSSTSQTGVLRTFVQGLEIGRYAGGQSSSNINYFKGVIDDIGIWNRALTQQEIIDLYSGCNSINASINLSNPSNIGDNLTLSAVATGNSLNYQWETNPSKTGWISLINNSTYSGVSTSDLTVSNLELSNHQQPFRVVVSDNNCSDTSDVVYVEITDTCINTVTQSVAVTDTLIIDVSLAGLNAPNNINTMKVYPNPSNDIVNIDNGDYALMNGYSIKIINALGQEVYTSSINTQLLQVPVNQLGSVGNYLINIYDNQSQLVESKVLVLE